MKKAGWLRQFLKHILSRKKKSHGRRKYQTPVDPETMKELVPEAVQKELEKQRGRADRAEEQIQKLNEQISHLKGEREKETLEKARTIKKQYEKVKQKNRLDILLDKNSEKIIYSGLENYPSFFSDGMGNFWERLKGFRIEQTPQGATVNLIVKSTKDDKKLGILPTSVSFEDLPYLFFPNSLVRDGNLGKIPLNLTSKGEFIPPFVSGAPAEPSQITEEENEVLKINLSGIVKGSDPKVKEAILVLFRKWMDANSRAAKAEEKASKALMAKREAEMSLKSSKEIAKSTKNTNKALMEKIDELTKDQSPLKIREQSARLESAGAEMAAQKAFSLLDRAYSKLEEYGLLENEKAKEDARNALIEAAKITNAKPQQGGGQQSGQPTG